MSKYGRVTLQGGGSHEYGKLSAHKNRMLAKAAKARRAFLLANSPERKAARKAQATS